MTVTAYIAFGGNLGDVRATFVAARSELGNEEGIDVTSSSKLYRTPPLGPEGQPDYLNAVVEIETGLEPLQLLDLLQRIETGHGRVRQPEQPRWGARTLDLDIIAYDDTVLNSERLTLPHPHMHERMFVLRPLCDLAPAWQHSLLDATAEQLMQRLLKGGEAPLPEGEPW